MSSDNASEKSVEENEKIVDKKMLTQKIKHYIQVDELLKQKSEMAKEKKELEKFLLNYMEKNNASSIDIDGDIIRRVKKEKKAPLDKKYIQNELLVHYEKNGLVNDDGEVTRKTNGTQIVRCVMESVEDRPVVSVVRLERRKNK